MINSASLLFSLVAVVFVVVRAVALDKTTPWFTPTKTIAAKVRSTRIIRR